MNDRAVEGWHVSRLELDRYRWAKGSVHTLQVQPIRSLRMLRSQYALLGAAIDL